VKAKLARYVLDSFAVLAYLQKEPGSARVAEVLGRARRRQAEVYLSVINLGETAYTIERAHGLTAAKSALAALDQLPILLVPVDRPLALAAAHLKANYAIAYADAFAAALALQQNATVLIGDPEFLALERVLTIDWLAQA
jgi:predicted nucleic acid-binding protein